MKFNFKQYKRCVTEFGNYLQRWFERLLKKLFTNINFLIAKDSKSHQKLLQNCTAIKL